MRIPTHAYKVLTALLYGRHSFIQRHPGGGVTCHCNLLRQSLHVSRTSIIKTSLERLQAIGLIEGVQWHKHWFYCRTTTPIDMARISSAGPEAAA